MAANRPNLGLQIALIIFVLITIALGVSTVIYFNQNKESLAAEKAAKDLQAKSDLEKKESDAAFVKIQDILKGRDDQQRPIPTAHKGKLDPIFDDFEKHRTLYGATFPDAASTYPQMLERAADAYLALQGRVAERDGEIAELKIKVKAEADKVLLVKADYEKGVADSNAEKEADRKTFNDDRGAFEGEKQALARELEKKNADVKEVVDQKDDEIKKRKEDIVKLRDAKKAGEKVISEFQKVDIKAPDGTIVRVSQRERTVWIDKGRVHGIKPQMIFSVYDRSTENITGVEPKGAIEVIRVEPNYSEARITKDDIKDPLLKEDKIMNEAYLAGKPQHFAIAGFIDMDGDGQSDMNRLLTLISNNGGVVDAMIDDNGKLTGAITPATKLVVMGESPTDVKGKDSLKAFTNMMKDADDAKIQKMPLADFLKYMGYQGHERSIPLGKDADAVPSGTPFKQRPARGEGGGAFP